MSPITLTLSGISILAKAVHPLKALVPIDATEFGIVMEGRLWQFRKAFSPISVTSSDRRTNPSSTQLLNAPFPTELRFPVTA